METRLIVASDAALLAQLHADSFGAAAWSEVQISQSLSLPTTRGWMGEGAGFILCQFADEEIEILTFCVAPQMRRQGIAENLLHAVIAAARQKNAHKIFLEVAVDNVAAIALYEKAGFARTSIRKNYYPRGSERIDALILTFEFK